MRNTGGGRGGRMPDSCNNNLTVLLAPRPISLLSGVVDLVSGPQKSGIANRSTLSRFLSMGVSQAPGPPSGGKKINWDWAVEDVSQISYVIAGV
eukprot:8498184-Pyramimonas_sp.AAC.1